MPKTIVVKLSSDSIDRACQRLESYKTSLQRKGVEICRRLSIPCAVKVSLGFASAIYKGEKDYHISVDKIDNGYVVKADGETALILEFGAGVTFGYGHPQESEFNMGAGTYPGQVHAMDPRGWWIPKAKGGGHTFGNPPTMAMYLAAKETREEVERVAREVFKS